MSVASISSLDAVSNDLPPTAGGASVVRVFVLGDGDLARHGLCARLNAAAEIEVVGSRRSGPDTVSEVGGSRAQVIVVQARLSDREVIACARRIRLGMPALPALLAGWVDREEAFLTMAVVGACGIVSAYAESSILAIAVHRAMAVTPKAARQDRTANPFLEKWSGVLTGSEIGLLEYLSAGLTDAQIAQCLHAHTETVTRQIDALVGKLSVREGASDPMPSAGGVGDHSSSRRFRMPAVIPMSDN